MILHFDSDNSEWMLIYLGSEYFTNYVYRKVLTIILRMFARQYHIFAVQFKHFTTENNVSLLYTICNEENILSILITAYPMLEGSHCNFYYTILAVLVYILTLLLLKFLGMRKIQESNFFLCCVSILWMPLF